MTLCSNRREGLNTNSHISAPIPTSCFVDTVLIPLPIWISLVVLPILFLIGLRYRKQNYDPSTAHLRAASASQRRTCSVRNIPSMIYYVLIIATILMQVLEIVRLELIHFGIGLLPFVFVGLLLGAYLHWSEGVGGRVRFWQVVNLLLWVGGMTMCVVKVVGLCYEGIHAREGSKYPMEDQVTDTAVIAGLYAALAILEIVIGAMKRSERSRNADEMSLGSGTSPVLGQSAFMQK